MNAITLNITFNSIDDLQAFVADRQQTQAAAPVHVPVFNVDPPLADDSSSERFYEFKLPAVGTNIHWSGGTFDFDGTVDRVDEYADNMSDKCVWVRRSDTGKLVSLTGDDLNRFGKLTAL